jgi:hypothetical protein
MIDRHIQEMPEADIGLKKSLLKIKRLAQIADRADLDLDRAISNMNRLYRAKCDELARLAAPHAPRNVERDAEIVRLWNDDRSDGLIFRKMKRTYPQITLSMVRSVLRRSRTLGLLKPHRA